MKTPRELLLQLSAIEPKLDRRAAKRPAALERPASRNPGARSFFQCAGIWPE